MNLLIYIMLLGVDEPAYGPAQKPIVDPNRPVSRNLDDIVKHGYKAGESSVRCEPHEGVVIRAESSSRSSNTHEWLPAAKPAPKTPMLWWHYVGRTKAALLTPPVVGDSMGAVDLTATGATVHLYGWSQDSRRLKRLHFDVDRSTQIVIDGEPSNLSALYRLRSRVDRVNVDSLPNWSGGLTIPVKVTYGVGYHALRVEAQDPQGKGDS